MFTIYSGNPEKKVAQQSEGTPGGPQKGMGPLRGHKIHLNDLK